MTGVEKSAVHTLDGRTFFSDMQSTALWRAAVGLDLLSGQKMHSFRWNKNVTLRKCRMILAGVTGMYDGILVAEANAP